MRDHTKLTAFQKANTLAVATFLATRKFPKEDRYGLAAQMRRAAVSAASNIVEGCARPSQADYLRFLDVAYGSARELQYQIGLASKLGYLDADSAEPLETQCTETTKVLNGLIRALRRTK